jgi:hypothetical protein
MAAMFSAHLERTPDSPTPYRVVVRRLGEVVRVQPVGSVTEGNRALSQLLRSEREYEKELQASLELDI